MHHVPCNYTEIKMLKPGICFWAKRHNKTRIPWMLLLFCFTASHSGSNSQLASEACLWKATQLKEKSYKGRWCDHSSLITYTQFSGYSLIKTPKIRQQSIFEISWILISSWCQGSSILLKICWEKLTPFHH